MNECIEKSQCPKCDMKELITEESPDLELELEYGEPYTRYTQYCNNCGYETQYSEASQ